MPNHVHLLVVPSEEDGLARAVGEAHRRYTRAVNFRKGWRGHLWQGRFASYPLDDAHAYEAARYIELNPVRAGLVQTAGQWRWSSARAHLAGRDDALVKVRPLLEAMGDWREYLEARPAEALVKAMRRHEGTGRPLGSAGFVKKLEHMVGRALSRGKPGPKPGSARGGGN